MKTMIKILLGFIILIIIGGSIIWIKLNQNMNTIKEIPIENIDFTSYEDGIYEGLYYYEEQIGAKVEVHIKDGFIDNIVLVDHVHGLGQKAESIIDQVILEQSIDVDYISRASTSSKVILLAIDDAMKGNES
ncbi:hypothetical protein BK010_04415 [Tenericutes bacterium MO-XQ]|nr:hypothetical protein BK010_04415 [Tenericutes bacterium MO-XQ]